MYERMSCEGVLNFCVETHSEVKQILAPDVRDWYAVRGEPPYFTFSFSHKSVLPLLLGALPAKIGNRK